MSNGWRWALAAAWMGVIFAFSAQPRDVLNFGQPLLVSKLAHVSEYAILAWLFQWALDNRRAWRLAWLLAVLYAVTDEFHQSFVPGRTSTVADVMIDALGAAIGLAAAAWPR